MSVTPTQVIGWAFTAYVSYSCIDYIRSGEMRDDFGVFKGWSGRNWARLIAGVLVCFACLIGVAFLGDHLPHWLKWSWLSLLATKGESDSGANLNLAGATVPIYGPIFVLLLMANLPRLAGYEEEMFRKGTKNWVDAVPRSILFGLMHMIVGVPLHVALGLAIPGMWFTAQYFKGGLKLSTATHAFYNMLMATLLLSWVITDQVNMLSAKPSTKPAVEAKTRN